MREPSLREPYLTAFVKSSLTRSRTAKRASEFASKASSRSTNARAWRRRFQSPADTDATSSRSSPAAIRSPYPSTEDLYRRRVGRVQARERQVAENEVRFRALNERLRERGAAWEGR